VADVLKRLMRASFEGIEFPVSTQSVTDSNTIVKRAGLAQDGRDIDDAGHDGEEGSFSVPFYNNLRGWEGVELFPRRFNELRNKFKSKRVGGQLIHPVEGVMKVGIGEWGYEVDSLKRNGVTLTFRWSKIGSDSTSALLLFRNDARNTPDAVARRASVADATAAGETGARVAPTGYVATSDTVSSELSYLEQQQRTRGEVQASITAMLSVIDGNSTLLNNSVYAVEYAELFRALSSLRNSVLDVRTHYLTVSASSVYVTPRDMSVWEVAADPRVYNDAGQTHRIVEANNLSNAARIPAGTRLEIAPMV